MFLIIKDETERLMIEKLYIKHKNTLFKIVYNILGDQKQAEDALHTTFVKVIEYIHRIESIDEKSRLSFLCIICKNTAIDMYNNNKKRYSKELSPESIDDFADEIYENPADICISNESIRVLIDAIKSFSDTYRDVFILKYVSDLSNEEISDVLNIPQATVRKRLQRGKEILRKALKGVGFNEN